MQKYQILCYTIEEVIRYAKSKKKAEAVREEKFIVGYQEESIRRNAIRGQKTGITIEECQAAGAQTVKGRKSNKKGVSRDG